jgi:glycolate oxidase
MPLRDLFLGIDGVDAVDEPNTLERLREDKSGQPTDTAPSLLVTPRSVEAVQEVMRVASAHTIPVVPRGGGSGLAGGAIGTDGEIVLDLSALNQILEISVEDRLARVEAGVINASLNAEAQKHGLWFAPDPSSREWSTVGGNIATNAGGLLCAKYGVTRESVLQLKVVLADGRLIDMGHRSVKGVTGLDLCQLMIGSEGTLGVIVEATVKLLPLDSHPVWTLRAEFASAEEAAKACVAITSEGYTPAILELIDDHSHRMISAYLGRDRSDNRAAVVIAQTNGASSDSDSIAMAKVLERSANRVERVPQGSAAEDLLHERRSMHPAMEAHGMVLIEDVAVPRSRLAEMFAEIRRIEGEYSLTIPTVAHAADGNLHPNFVYEGERVPEHIWRAADDLFRSALSLGGTLTGEHGVGLLKRKWLRDELGDDQWQLQRDIKTVFDPQGILNPGKVFTS